ncbi:Retrotransposon gag domain-containing protein [Dioscorea alata]|uniref:Retrotransposon gag domain-containing protein n=1 Tax=Dioscorea alata TaxID=55571 RepID=A0ACB7WTU4_DIOAL|nr:Retrotransposon gag domain-containing protein [Dioscorea alata]
MAPVNNTNNTAASCTIFLGEGTQVKLPYAFVYTGIAGAEIKFGIISEFVNFVPSPPSSPSMGRRSNTHFLKRLVNINGGEDEEEPSFIITARGEESGIFKKFNATPTKSLMMGLPRLTKRKIPSPQEKASFVSFQDSKNNSSSSFTNSFEPLRMVKENSTTGELRSQQNNIKKGAGFQTAPRRNNDSSEEKDDNLIFTSNKDPMFAKLKKQLDQREKDHISMMHTVASLTGAISRLSDQVQNLLHENSRAHRQAPSVQVIQEEEDDEEEVLGLHKQDGTSTVPEPMLSREEVQKIVAAQLKQAKGATVKSDGDKPYSSFHDQVVYPKGYNVPKFKQFNGLGNPDQHLAHFITACGDTSNNPLTSVAFEWYANLQSESIQTWQQMKDSFRVRFGGVTDKITIADLANTRQNKDEKVIDYVMRWRNLSIKCEQPLDQVQAVGLLVGNIDNWIAPFLSSSDIHTFQDLISQVKKLERTSPRVVSTMQPIKRMSKKYSFRRDKVMKIFKDALKVGLQLAESKRPEEADKKDHPNFCPYHRILGHSIENCYEKNQKQIKLVEFHHKKSIIEEYIDSLEDYQQKERALITLGDYFPDEVKELLSDLDESQDEESMVETCRVITIYEEETWDDVDDEDALKLYYPDDGDSLSKQLYDRHGRPYVSKK